MTWISQKLDRLGDRTTPHFGQVSLWIVVSAALYSSTHAGLDYLSYDKGNVVSVLGLVVPSSVFDQAWLFYTCKAAFIASALLWIVRIGVPTTSWLTALFYTLTISILWENSPSFHHEYVLINLLLCVYALWYVLYADEIRAAPGSEFWRTPLYPRWGYLLSLFALGTFYGFAAYNKLLEGGVHLGDSGLSLQLWSGLLADPNSVLSRAILKDRLVANVIQDGAILFELASVAAIFLPRVRLLTAIGLFCFHLSADLTFHIPFRLNMVLVLLFYLPFFTNADAIASWFRKLRVQLTD